MGCCTRNGSSWITAIMVYTMLQSILSAVWQILQILLYECQLAYPDTQSRVMNVIYLMYYFNPKCLNDISHLNIQRAGDQRINESDRVYYLALTHLVFDIFWIFISIIALSVRSKKNSAFGVHIFWLCVAVAEFGVDITSVSFFTKDAITWQDETFFAKELTIAAIVMAIFSSRLILPLVINVCMFFGLISITKAMRKPPVLGVLQPHPQGVQRRHTQHRIVPLKPALRTPRPAHLQEQNMSRVNNWYNHYGEPMPRSAHNGQLSEDPNESHQRRHELLEPRNLNMPSQNLPLRVQNMNLPSQNMHLRPQNLPLHSQNMRSQNLHSQSQNMPLNSQHLRPQNLPSQSQNLPLNSQNLCPQNLPLHSQNTPVNSQNLRPQNMPSQSQNLPHRAQNQPQTNVEENDEAQTAYPNNWYNVYDSMQPTHLPRVKSDVRPQLHAEEEEEEEEREEPHLEDDYPRRGRTDLDSYEDAASELSYSDHPNFVGDHTNVMVNGVPSGTLRRQLPWSYVHEPGMFPRKQTRDLSVEAPPVPVPDYTMRINKNQRLDLDSWSQTSSPGPSARFNNRNPHAQ